MLRCFRNLFASSLFPKAYWSLLPASLTFPDGLSQTQALVILLSTVRELFEWVTAGKRNALDSVDSSGLVSRSPELVHLSESPLKAKYLLSLVPGHRKPVCSFVGAWLRKTGSTSQVHE